MEANTESKGKIGAYRLVCERGQQGGMSALLLLHAPPSPSALACTSSARDRKVGGFREAAHGTLRWLPRPTHVVVLNFNRVQKNDKTLWLTVPGPRKNLHSPPSPQCHPLPKPPSIVDNDRTTL